ncbi:Hypothetical protein R9X50_00244700 [Acrodontium crateriforme]|uniref:C2H2-type domain-containing protein n=1 Tax=Acrodontium crateriforme TaxID=150365 RepID=A0AAQ3M2G4_9PEZI|nr:Hypothetical protein R9X50_00244700 [Acrodontium crateriforme]
MMDGRNSLGRTISLLNSSDSASKIHLPPLTSHSRASSNSSSPTPPQTPNLVRSSSASSSNLFQSPSPTTPSFDPFDSAASAHLRKHQHYSHCYIVNPSSAKMDDSHQGPSMYPPIPEPTGAISSAYPMPQQMPSQQQPPPPPPPQQQQQQQPVQLQQLPSLPMQATHRSSNSPSSEPSRVSTVSATSTAKPQPKKNQYPCPLAKQFNCSDYFTTSGHAARHAKKHTGKKDAFCPECNKAFTRKDNMEQHRRTHQNGRGASRSTTTADDAKIKKPVKPATTKKSSIGKTDAQFEAAIEQQLVDQQAQALHAQQMVQQPPIDQGMMIPPSGPYYLGGLPSIDAGPIASLPMAIPPMSVRPPFHRTNNYSTAPNAEYAPPAAPMSRSSGV